MRYENFNTFRILSSRGNVQCKFPRILDDARKTKLLSYARTPAEITSPS